MPTDSDYRTLRRPPRGFLDGRVAKTQAALRARGLDAMIVTGHGDRGWLSGYTVGQLIAPFGAILVTREEAIYVARPVDYADCSAVVEHMEVTSFDHRHVGVEDRLLDLAAERGFNHLLLEASEVSVGDVRVYEGIFAAGGIGLEFATTLAPLRAIKDSWEIEQIREATRVTANAFSEIAALIRPGVTEWELAVELEHQVRLHGSGSTRTACLPIVASGPHSALPHAAPTERRLEAGDLVVLDFGATWNGYASDITRTMVVGVASDWQRELYAVVRSAQLNAIAAMRPGVAAAVVHEIAAARIAAAGYGDNFNHALGHGIGIGLPEQPFLSPRSRDILQTGNVTTVEPGAYLLGQGSVRIEDDVLVSGDGHEYLSPAASNELLELG
jgi:Xaa-Pro aminopeptidase